MQSVSHTSSKKDLKRRQVAALQMAIRGFIKIEPMLDPVKTIKLRGVRVHNLKSINVDIPVHRLTVITGVSGAGKSSLVFDTLYAEAQRRYLQSFSTYTRQFLERFDKPDAEQIGALPPAAAIRRSPTKTSPRATVASLTEIGEHIRLFFARAG